MILYFPSAAQRGNDGKTGHNVRRTTPSNVLRITRTGLAAVALMTGIAAVQVATSQAAPTSNVVINEVKSSGGSPGDWVELYNRTTSAIDISGWGFVDNDDVRVKYLIPAGTVLPAKGFLALDEAAFGFGLGAADSARLFNAAGVLADSHVWTAHATTTYGRCPDGEGDFVTTVAVTKAAANSCPIDTTSSSSSSTSTSSTSTSTTTSTTSSSVPAAVSLAINEIESSGGVPGDWIELHNYGSTAINLGGWSVIDNDDTHTRSVVAAGTSLAPGGYFIVEEATLGFGLGAADSARLFNPAGAVHDSYSWTAHAVTTSYGRCPNGRGTFVTTSGVSKGAANDCSSPIRFNEVESSGGAPGDWAELYNTGDANLSIAGFTFRDNDDTRGYVLPAGSTLAAKNYFVIEEAAFGFGLGAADSVRLFDTTGALVAEYTWTAHATTTYGRCPNGTGTFTTTATTTKGLANTCVGDVTQPSFVAWPGGTEVAAAGPVGLFNGNLSGLAYQPAAGGGGPVLWGARNGPGSLFRLVPDGASWKADTGNGWTAGKSVRYPDGTGDPDAEGVTLAGTPTDGLYVSTERNNAASGASRNSILRFDVGGATGAGSSSVLSASKEWN